MESKIYHTAVLFLLLVTVTAAEIRRVPQHYGTIQSAINAAANGDTVLAEPGTYYENIRFRGKRIVVASRFLLSGDEALIRATIINGSRPQHPDTASCVLFIDREDSSAVLAGFTLTGGRGTRWLDEHGAGYYREGGGVLSALSSPTIRNNLVIHNEAIDISRAASTGGGGIRSGDGAPRILNNVILANRAMYGGGIVLNYCAGAIVRNNVIAENQVWQAVANHPTYGGGGVWVNNILPRSQVANLVENNTIIGNSSSGELTSDVAARGGALVVSNRASVMARNNIIWANTQTLGGALAVRAGTAFSLTYSNVQESFSGNGNLTVYPAFADSGFYLAEDSPCVDAGDPGSAYDDPGLAGAAQWPSLGSTRNDMGAYGGAGRTTLARFSQPKIGVKAGVYDFGNILPGNFKEIKIPILNFGANTLILEQAQFSFNLGHTLTLATPLPLAIKPAGSDTLLVRWAPAQNGFLQDTLAVFSNDGAGNSPIKIALLGNSNPTPNILVNTSLLDWGNIPADAARKDTTFFIYNTGTGLDSVYLAIDYRAVQPPEAAAVSPTAAQIAAGDSLLVTFSIFPPLFARPLASLYFPRVAIQTRFSPGAPRFEKAIRFRLVVIVSVEAAQGNGPATFRLEQSYPNPFNPATEIRFTLAKPAMVSLKIFDVLGNEVATLKNEKMAAEAHAVRFEAGALAGGVYFCALRAGEFVATRKMILLR